ncbi:GPI inositol-deacylase [Sphaceloma murrayae]|uniref:GPI inositol-deacylase n=1 Tax=Sphaceloma murrayae TaxID=2082308 RepID=A0A2K1R163_9PEZI|nr:GPI inositol-deacylase [Sphaceloma murrayae]
MRRRHSGSGADEDDSPSSSDDPDNAHLHLPMDSRRIHDQQEEVNHTSPSRRRSIDAAKSLHAAVDATKDKSSSDSAKSTTTTSLSKPQREKGAHAEMIPDPGYKHRPRLRSPWSCSLLTIATTLVAFAILATIGRSFLTSHIDPKGCHMSFMRAAYAKFDDFDTEYTRFASKYSLYLYREGEIDDDSRVASHPPFRSSPTTADPTLQVKGIPVLFIPGNAGSYKQVRSLAAEAAYYYRDNLQHDEAAQAAGKRPLDFFSVDFNEDITAFHGQTLVDQADYLNDAIAYILSLYHNPHRSVRDPDLPDPTSVILVGHSMGGIVARAMLTRPNYLSNSVNTIITLSAPHARAPVSFDSDMINIYEDMNRYWRTSYSEQWASKNPLWHVTLVSIAGGGLDTVVPSDYSSLTSLVPETHGFTVFTSSIPYVWTGMDHLAITWCDQLRKPVIRAIYDVVDVRRPSQTRSRAERITTFRKRFLTGLEPVIEKQLPAQESRLLLTLEDETTSLSMHKEKILLKAMGQLGKAEAHVLPMPLHEAAQDKRFTVLTDQPLDGSSPLEVYFCGVLPHQHGQSASLFAMNMDLANGKAGSNRLACKSAAADVSVLPGSWPDSQYAFDVSPHLYYLEYELSDILEYNFIAIIDRSTETKPGFLLAEFASSADSTSVVQKSFPSLLSSGVQQTLPASRPMVHTIHIPVIHSALLAYRLSLHQTCETQDQLFRPLLRQYILKPYETKFFPNPSEHININLHGVSPYITPPLSSSHAEDGLSLQIWSDPSCNGTMSIDLRVDFYGSAGKLYMRYRTVFAAFPLLVVALVLRKQFKIYNASGIFISFAESMDQCIRTSLPLLFVALTFLALSLARTSGPFVPDSDRTSAGAAETFAGFTKNELLLGSYDPFFWFLIPLFGVISVGVCIAVNFTIMAVISLLALAYGLFFSFCYGKDHSHRPQTFSAISPLQRIITTSILILLVATIIPYQFAYLVLCLVQLATCVRATRHTADTRSLASVNMGSYSVSILVLLLWILPINLPVLVVWVHNLSVPYLTPFSSHHNILSILPLILLVETISTGAMIPRLVGRWRVVTNVLLFGVAVWAAVYGVTWAYTLHWAANVIGSWLVVVHFLGRYGGEAREDKAGVWGRNGVVQHGPGGGGGKWMGEVVRRGSRKKRP